jgi:FKBP-type peptidyl-prolyl cis-trans isomerase FkpA
MHHPSAICALLLLLTLGGGACAESPKSDGAGIDADLQLNKENTVTTSSGLEYEDLVVGDGETAKAGNTVEVHYTGWLTNGQKFDSSLDRREPFRFPLGGGRVIKGWDEGVAGMQVGGKRKLLIPPTLGYGARGAGNVIPPNATLVFEVELLAIR